MIKEENAVVIGAGIGGIAAALRLRSMGYKVIVIEKNAVIGGKLNELHWEDFRWDMGPSLFTLPELVDELFELFGDNASDKFEYEKLKIVCKYFYADGTVLDAYNAPDEFADEVNNKLGVPHKTIENYLRKSEEIYQLTSPVFIFDTFHKLNWKRIKKGLKSLLNFHKLKAFKTLHNLNKGLLKEPHLIQLFDRFATYNGSNPYRAPATLSVIPYLEHCLGAFFPKKGMYSIVQALVNLAQEKGIIFKTNETVTKIKHSNGNIVAVETNRNKYSSKIAVSDSDIVPLYQLFEPTYKIRKRLLKHERSSSALIFYWAINRNFANLDVHNIFFAANYKEEFDFLFKYKTFYSDPSVYLFISSKYVDTDAPEGMENWFVMINTPAIDGQNWEEFISESKKVIITKLNRHLKVDIEQHILSEELLEPKLIEARTSSYKGSLYGASSNSKWSAFQRHANYSNQIKGMYFVGGSVHPGGGIPLCLSSAKIVAQLIEETQ